MKPRRLRSQILIYLFFCFISKKSLVFIEEGNFSEKVVIADEKLDGIDIDDIGKRRGFT